MEMCMKTKERKKACKDFSPTELCVAEYFMN